MYDGYRKFASATYMAMSGGTPPHDGYTKFASGTERWR